jgi:hypothetical protein
MHFYTPRKYFYKKINVHALCAFWYYFMFILPVFEELFEPNRRFTLTVDPDVRDSDVRDGPMQL